MDVLHSFLPPQNPIKRHWVGGTLTGPHAQERERERVSHFGSSRPAAVLLVRGALGDGPPGGQRVVSASLAGGRSPEWGEA